MIGREQLDELMGHRGGPAVTLTMPCGLPEPGVRPDPIRLGNLIEAAARRLEATGCERNVAEAVLGPARRLVGEPAFWAVGRGGLALFLAPGFDRALSLDQAPEEAAWCGDRFRVTALLAEVAPSEPQFFVLAVSAGGATLYRAGRRAISEMAADLPRGVAAVTERTDYQVGAQANPVSAQRGGQTGAVPAQALGPAPSEERKTELLHYLNQLATAVRAALAGSSAPLVLAAQPEVAGNFRKLAELAALWPEHLAVNPESLDVGDLHRRALALLAERLSEDDRKALARFDSLSGSPRAVAEAAELVKAAHWGRMDTLILAAGRHVWGRFDPEADRVETHAQPEASDDDLADLAAQETLSHGGRVQVVDPARLPAGAAAVGILRY